MSPRSDVLTKKRRAAADPLRPGVRCSAPPGTWRPVVDASRCEAKGDCVDVCPNGVFAVGRMDDDTYRSLGMVARLRVRAHGRQSATTPGADACRACGLCVVACPEAAIRLVPPA